MNLFAYGTLTFPEVWKRIAIQKVASERAVLNGFSIYRVRNAVFPGIVRSRETDSVAGVLYRDLDEDTLFELDAYESDFYERETVWVSTAAGENVECHAYVVPESHRNQLSEEVWDPQWFAENELENYLDGS